MNRIEEDTLRFLFLLQPVEEQKQAEQIERKRKAAGVHDGCPAEQRWWRRSASAGKTRSAQGWTKRSLSVRQRKKIQKVSWGDRLSDEKKISGDAYTFDDVLIVPLKSDVLPTEVRTTTRLTNRIELNVPIVSAAMDTVTESRLAIALAQQGGIGIIHKNMPIEKQAAEVDKVKRSESGMIVDPITMSPNDKIEDAVKLMAHYKISGVPITENGRLVGILTNRDLRFETRFHLPIREVMTKENLVTVPVGTTLEEAQRILAQASHRKTAGRRQGPESQRA